MSTKNNCPCGCTNEKCNCGPNCTCTKDHCNCPSCSH